MKLLWYKRLWYRLMNIPVPPRFYRNGTGIGVAGEYVESGDLIYFENDGKAYNTSGIRGADDK